MVSSIHRKVIAAGSRIRVLVVDDSVVIRRLVSYALSEEPVVEVVGSASNGAIATERIQQLNPDLITLDLEMPEMDGLELLRWMRKHGIQCRVIMFSTLTERGALQTLDCLALGADDYVAKAANAGSFERSLASLRAELIPKIRQFFTLEQERPAERNAPVASREAPRVVSSASTGTVKVVAIGVSTGGPAALAVIIPQFPPDFPVPILIVQHMPPLFTRFLAQRLQTGTELRVAEAGDGTPVKPGTILIAPGDYHMRVRNGGGANTVHLDQSAPENSCRPAVDVLFRSVGEVYGAGAVAAVLTGMGQDGLRGARELRAKGAEVIAQDEATSVVWGMPGAVVEAGIASCVVPLERVVPEILKRTGVS